MRLFWVGVELTKSDAVLPVFTWPCSRGFGGSMWAEIAEDITPAGQPEVFEAGSLHIGW